MAAVTLLGSATFNTTSGTHTVTDTPAVGDLIIIVAANSGNLSGALPTDNNSDGLGTYTEVLRCAKATSADTMRFFIRNGLVGSASSTVFTHAVGTSSGGGIVVLKVTGMARAGYAAMMQQSTQSNQAASGTPAPVFASAVLTGNPVIGAVFNATNPATMTARTGFTERADVGYATPDTGLEVISIDSGETGTTMTWGGTSASAFCSAVLELDTSAMGTEVTISENTGATYTGLTATMGKSGSPTTNYVSDTTFEAVSYTAGDYTHGFLLPSGLSNIASGSTIKKARFRIRVSSAVCNAAVVVQNISAYIMLVNQVQSQLTWNIYSSGNNFTTAGGLGASDVNLTPIATEGIPVVTNLYFIFDGPAVTQFAQDVVDGVISNYGVLLARNPDSAEDQAYVVFNSDNATDGLRPEFICEVETGGTTHDATGALVGGGATIAGSASSFSIHTSSGALVGGGAVIVGAASSATTRAATGALVGGGAVIAGSAARTRQHNATGVLAGQGAVVVGSASSFTPHDASGVLVGGGAVVVGDAERTGASTVHDATGVLVGDGAIISGDAERVAAPVTHDASGVLVGAGAILSGLASRSGVEPEVLIRGGGIDHQRPRRKATLADKPNQHLDQIIAKAFKTVFGELTDKKAPKTVQKQANKIVSEYAETYRPKFDEVDWFAFNQDLEAVQRLFALYQKEITDTQMAEQKLLEAKKMFELIENDNLEFLLMH